MQGRHIKGRDLRDLREQAGLKPSQFSALVTCSSGYLRNIENWGDQPSAAMAHRFARELSKHLDRIITIDDFSDEVAAAEDAA